MTVSLSSMPFVTHLQLSFGLDAAVKPGWLPSLSHQDSPILPSLADDPIWRSTMHVLPLFSGFWHCIKRYYEPVLAPFDTMTIAGACLFKQLAPFDVTTFYMLPEDLDQEQTALFFSNDRLHWLLWIPVAGRRDLLMWDGSAWHLSFTHSSHKDNTDLLTQLLAPLEPVVRAYHPETFRHSPVTYVDGHGQPHQAPLPQWYDHWQHDPSLHEPPTKGTSIR